MAYEIPGVVPLTDDQSNDQTTAHVEPYRPPPPASKTDIPGAVPREDPSNNQSYLSRAWQFLRSDLPEAVARDLTPSISLTPWAGPSAPAPGLSSSPDVPPQIVSNPNAYIARGVRDVTDKLTEYPNPEYGAPLSEAETQQAKTQNAADRAAFNEKYGYDTAMPWFRGVGQAAVTAPFIGPLLGMAGGAAETVAPSVGPYVASLEGLPGFAARTALRASEGGVAGAGVGAAAADPSQPIGPQIGQGALWGLGTGAAISPVLEGLGSVATRIVPGEVPPVTQSGTAKGISNVAFGKAKAAGAGLTSDAVNGALDDVGKIVTVPPDAASAVDPNAATTMAKKLDTLRGKPLSLEGLQATIEEINGKIDGEVKPDGSLSSVGNKLVQQKNALLDAANNASRSQVTGGPSGFDAWNDGKNAWSYQLKMRELEALRQKAASTPDPSGSLKTYVNGMLADDARMRNWPPEARAALAEVGKTGFMSDVGNILADKYIGSALIGGLTTGAGALLGGGVPGMLGGGVVAVPAQVALARTIRALQQAATQRQLQGVITGLGEHIRGQQSPQVVWPAPTRGLLGSSTTP